MSEEMVVTMEMESEITDTGKTVLVTVYCAFMIFLGFMLDGLSEIYTGLQLIVQSPGVLLSDYFIIGGLGAALINAGAVGLCGLLVVKLAKSQITGPVIAAIFTMVGFALFGKNIFNIWPIIIGVYIFSCVQRENFSKSLLAALFGTTLGPLVGQVAFGFGLPPAIGLTLGVFLGMVAGFIIPPLSRHLLKAHQGFNLYNIGFTGGILGMVFMAIFRALGLQSELVLIWARDLNSLFVPIFAIYFLSMLIIGLQLSGYRFTGLKRICKFHGTAVSDFTDMAGFGPTMMNMGCVGLIGLAYLVLVGGDLNGPTLGGLFTIVGFGAFGKHIRNIIPVMLGVFLGTLISPNWSANAPGVLLAALFGTTLAPLSGKFGPLVGVIAGLLHLSVVMNVGYLHGGMNLYNNGFAGGLVATFMVGFMATVFMKKFESSGEAVQVKSTEALSKN